ncbi:5-formyltetrahydrofolate cyclo-ligase [Bacillus sp. FJAT-29790]|uniref:5-formyltetrahydrofolate cyclo-ligase n=1 Tax=Bacillus sp. FJAT-29790 TaxID=1895002 RepID=UPI001C2444C7|nr:5-formyltetrahydrofolate cyclo-ligase [Bacillus sp. FJAT-29790]MBU8879386.1 5-formyltetrahydrofolate cyclo-ligase [Bacillus sp. FJAT-29790]
MKNEKQISRKQMIEKLASITKPHYEHRSYRIAQSLYGDPFWKEASIVGITLSNHPEVDTYQIIRKAWEEGKQVVIPKCLPKSREMVFRTLNQFDQLESVYSGLFEPIEAVTKEVTADEIDLLIVPGLAFTEAGYRLGFGGGYYDRYLTRYKGHTLTLAFQTQIVSELPLEGHDIPVQKIITDEKVLNMNE